MRGLVLVNAQGAREVASTRATAAACCPDVELAASPGGERGDPEAVIPLLLGDRGAPNWRQRLLYYQTRQRVPGRRDEPGAYAAVEFALGSCFDARA